MNPFKKSTRSTRLTTLAAFCFALSGIANAGVLSSTAYKAAKDEIATKYQSEKESCKALSGNANDICMAEAKGHEKVAEAELNATDSPSVKHDYEIRISKADAAFAVAKEKCDDLAGNVKDVCVKEAKAAHVAAVADAKLAQKTADVNATAREKTADANAIANAKTADANATANTKKAEARQDAASDKRDADYAVAKEKCDALAGDVKANCIKEAKTRYGQS